MGLRRWISLILHQGVALAEEVPVGPALPLAVLHHLVGHLLRVISQVPVPDGGPECTVGGTVFEMWLGSL